MLADRLPLPAFDDEAYYAENRRLHLREFWRDLAYWTVEPAKAAVPHVWRWDEVEPRLRLAAEEFKTEKAERRALIFLNPALGGKVQSTTTMFGAYSLYKPGDTAGAHRHTPAACRLGLIGEGGYSTVDGEKCYMSRGDVVLTPSMSWHNHGNDGSDDIIWMDVLDMPLIQTLNSSFFEFNYEEPDDAGVPARAHMQTERFARDYSVDTYASGGRVPLFLKGTRPAERSSPQFIYRYAETRALMNKFRDHEGSPHDGIAIELIDPSNGGSVMPTLGITQSLIRPGEQTLPKRETASTMYTVLEGKGSTQVGDTRIDWQENDVFCVPGWSWSSHENASSTADVVLHAVSDAPAQRKLLVYRLEVKQGDGSVVRIAS